MSYAFTNKIFSDEAIRKGNKIVFTANRLQYQSLDKKIRLLQQTLPYGIWSKDDVREILDLPPIGGDEGAKVLQSLNYVNTDKADEYQTGGE